MKIALSLYRRFMVHYLRFKRWIAFFLAVVVLDFAILDWYGRLVPEIYDDYNAKAWSLEWTALLAIFSLLTCLWAWWDSPPTAKLTPFKLVPLILVLAYLIVVFAGLGTI